jgi:hypothetical protein
MTPPDPPQRLGHLPDSFDQRTKSAVEQVASQNDPLRLKNAPLGMAGQVAAEGVGLWGGGQLAGCRPALCCSCRLSSRRTPGAISLDRSVLVKQVSRPVALPDHLAHPAEGSAEFALMAALTWVERMCFSK